MSASSSTGSNGAAGFFFFFSASVAFSVISYCVCQHRKERCLLQERVSEKETREQPRKVDPPAAVRMTRQPSMNVSMLGDSASIKGNRLAG